MRLVLIESPYAGDVEVNEAYARRAVKDSLLRGEAPLASHLLYTQQGILDDTVASERRLGINAGHAWMTHADAVVLYVDNGITPGMIIAKTLADKLGVPVEYRRLENEK